MRVLHVIQRYWPYTGGAERHLQEISERLVREGHDVTVFTTDALDLELFWSRRGRRVERLVDEHNGVKIIRFPVRHLPWPQLSFSGLRFAMTLLSDSPLPLTGILKRLSPLAPYVPDLVSKLASSEMRFDVVAGMNICFEGMLWAARDFAARTRTPFVILPLTHLGETDHSIVRRYYTMSHQLALEAQSDAVLAQTGIEIEYLVRHGVPRDIIVRAGVGVNPDRVLGGSAERFRAKHGISGPFVFYLGTSAFDKGTVHLVEAMARLWKSGEPADLIIAGPSLSAFDNFLGEQPTEIRSRCHVLGVVSEEDKRDLLAAGTVFAMPSRTDSFGIVYLESWLYGKPVIGARAGGVPEVIDDQVDGILVEFGDVAELARAIDSLLRNPLLASALGESGRRKVIENYTWDRIYPRVREVYERLWKRTVTAG